MFKSATQLFLCLIFCVYVLCACQIQEKQDDVTLATIDAKAMETSEVTEVMETTEKNETAETTEETVATEATEGTEATEVTKETETTGETEEIEATEVTKETETTGETEETEATEATRETETTETTEATEATEPTEEQVEPEWKAAYLAFLEDRKAEYGFYALVYVDGDDIPELYSRGIMEAGGDCICTYKNGVVIESRLSRIGGGRYIPRSGMLINTNGNMGYYSTTVYRLTDSGFTLILRGLEEHSYEYLENGEVKETIEYFIEGESVTEEAFYSAISAVFDYAQAVSFSENAVSYDEIKQQILDC